MFDNQAVKKSWSPILLVGALLSLLVLLAALQYLWLAQISDAERTRLQNRLESDTKHFAEDFNKEIRSAYFTFQVDPGDWLKNDWTGFNGRYKLWLSQTAYPQLIKDFYFVSNDSPPMRYEAAAQAFKSCEWTDELREVKLKLQDNQKIARVEPIAINTFTLLMPNYATGRETSVDKNNVPSLEADLSGYLVIKLDKNTVRQLLTDLVGRYFPVDEAAIYNFSITNKTDLKVVFSNNQKFAVTPESNDASILLFDLSMSNYAMIVNSKVFSQNRKVITKNVTKNPPPYPKMSKNDSLKIQMQDTQNAEPKEIEAKGLWSLNVQHPDGSLENFVNKTRNKNLAISFGILSLLAVSIILIFVSTQRAKILAQRQIDFVSAVSHEFRTPLSVIYSAGENLADGVTKDERQVANYGDLIKREGGKLSQMVEQILEFAGARSDRKKYNFSETSVSQIIENALAQCQVLIDEKGVFVEKEFAENLPKISADENALSRAVQNLIVNAVKYGNGNNWLKISARAGDGRIEISVEDKGIGIAKKDLAKIFAPFFRAKEVADAQIHGSGLGLSLVRQTIEAHGGEISAKSEIGRGSRFTIYLPFII